MDGLTHPRDITAWEAWNEARHPVRRVRHALDRRGPAELPRVALHGREGARVLVLLESGNPTSVAALLSPVAHLPDAAVLWSGGGPAPATLGSGGVPAPAADAVDRAVPTDGVVLLAGQSTPLSRLVIDIARSRRSRVVVAQHGLLTPAAPPLPGDCHLLAWSASDGEFWRSGRDDVLVTTVGAQLLADAAARGGVPASDGPPVYLGQLHAAEMSRARLAVAAATFCRRERATYRPHPSERDKISRAHHALWERLGVAVDRAGVPLVDTRRPVVSVFSTGVLEAAALGLPAWVDMPHPPRWLQALWERSGMSRWGGAPTPSPERPAVEPSRAAAETISGMMTP